jgi:phage shock protein A
MILAEASNEFTGQWVFAGLAILGGIGVILAIIAYFATAREMATVTTSIQDLTNTLSKQNQINEERAAEIHGRINPLEAKVGELKGATEAHEKSFEKFTRVIESTSRASNETITAFTRSLDTFASVVERSTRERNGR